MLCCALLGAAGRAEPHLAAGALPASGAERSEAGLGTTKEVLFIIDFLDFKEFLGFPILLLGFPRISYELY